MQADLWSLERVKDETRKGIRQLLVTDTGLANTSGTADTADTADIDVSYITQDLLDRYRSSAQEKDAALCTREGTKENAACFWGNHWAHIAANQWAYTNTNASRGCDPVTESCLCGSGYTWKAQVSRLLTRTCPNAAANAYMAWP